MTCLVVGDWRKSGTLPLHQEYRAATEPASIAAAMLRGQYNSAPPDRPTLRRLIDAECRDTNKGDSV